MWTPSTLWGRPQWFFFFCFPFCFEKKFTCSSVWEKKKAKHDHFKFSGYYLSLLVLDHQFLKTKFSTLCNLFSLTFWNLTSLHMTMALQINDSIINFMTSWLLIIFVWSFFFWNSSLSWFPWHNHAVFPLPHCFPFPIFFYLLTPYLQNQSSLILLSFIDIFSR